MKKIITTFFASLLLFNLIFIVNFFWSLYNGVGFINNFEKAYNSGNLQYKSEDFEGALGSYSGAIKVNDNDYRVFHNLGNSYFRIGELEKSIESYQSALSIYSGSETQKNLEFVQNKLNKQQQEQESPDEQGDNNQSEQDGDSNESSGQQEETSSQPQQNGADQENNTSGLNEQTKAILEARAQEIEESQQQLQKYYNKNYQPNTTQSLFDRIFNNSLLENSGEKDW